MSTETVERTDVGTTVEVDVDLEATVPCEWPVDPCNQVGEWRMRMTCCKTSVVMCDPHRLEVIRGLRTADLLMAITGRVRVCKACGTLGAGDPTWTRL